MRFLAACFRKDLLRILRDPTTILLSVGMPVLVALLMRLAFGGSGATPTATLLIADHDQSFLSGFLVRAFDQGPLADLVDPRTVTEEEGRARMEKGGASGLLVIPEDFGARVLRREPVTLTLVTNPSQRILPGILRGALEFLGDAISGLQRILGPNLDRITAGPPAGETTLADSTVASFSVTVNRLVARAKPYLFPPVIRLETVAPPSEENGPQRGFGDLFLPTLLFMGILFAAQGVSDDFWKERRLGTLRRSAITPRRLAVLVGGKMLAGGALIAAVGTAALLAGRFLFSVEVHHPLPAVIWMTLSGVVMLLLLTWIQMAASSQRAGGILTNVVFFPLLMLGGSFFPFEAMPEWLARIGRFTPNGWALARFKEILWGTGGPLASPESALILLAMEGILYLAVLVRLRRFARA